jgi:hypothetical protein
MADFSSSEISQLIEIINNRNWVNHTVSLLAGVAPIVAIWGSFWFFNKQHVQIAKSKVIEKDIDRLYEAADLFFEYSDAINLFLSMLIKKADFMARDLEVPIPIMEKTREATDSVHPKIHSIYKSYFYLLSIGATDIAEKIENYRFRTLSIRKQHLILARCNQNDKIATLSFTAIELMESEKTQLVAARDTILREIASFKRKLIESASTD